MTRKEAMDLMLSKVEEGKKEAFIEALRGAKTKEERFAVIKEYGVGLTQAEAEALKAKEGNAVSDEELDEAAGGCKCSCRCECYCYCM